MDIAQRIDGLKHLIGNTPLLEISYKYKGTPRRLFVKAENLNMTGSIKDRMAWHILTKAHHAGLLKESSHIIEATSGNTGISFSAIGRALGHKVTIFMPDWMSLERTNLIRSLGAQIRLVSREDGGFLGSIAFPKSWLQASRILTCPINFQTATTWKRTTLQPAPRSADR